MTQTGNPFDFAVQGDAWFGIDTPAGTVMTRDGRFSMNENGELMSLEGHPVLDAGGAPIQLDPRNGPPKAGADGSLRQGDKLVGAIGLFNFDPRPELRALRQFRHRSLARSRSRSSTAPTSASRRALSRNPTSIRCWR